jgi:hypothetical protein
MAVQRLFQSSPRVSVGIMLPVLHDYSVAHFKRSLADIKDLLKFHPDILRGFPQEIVVLRSLYG